MVQTGLTGGLLIQRLNLYDDDILALVKHGLQPYGKDWKPLLPPGSETFPQKIAALMRKCCVIENQFPSIKKNTYDYNEWCKLHIKPQRDSKGKLKNIKHPDGTSTKIRIRYSMLIANIDNLETKCLWKNFIFPHDAEEKDKIEKMLLDARYKMEDILELEHRQEQDFQEKPPVSDDIKSAESQKLSPVDEPEKLPDEKPVTDTRKAIALAEAAKLRRDNPTMDKVKAKMQVDIALKNHGYKPYSRSQFIKITKDLRFPPALRGRKPNKKKK